MQTGVIGETLGGDRYVASEVQCRFNIECLNDRRRIAGSGRISRKVGIANEENIGGCGVVADHHVARIEQPGPACALRRARVHVGPKDIESILARGLDKATVAAEFTSPRVDRAENPGVGVRPDDDLATIAVAGRPSAQLAV